MTGRTLLPALLAAVLTLAACGDDTGSNPTATRTEMLVRKWRVDSTTRNDTLQSGSAGNAVEFRNDGTYQAISIAGLDTATGRWSWLDNETRVRLTRDRDSVIFEMDAIELSADRLNWRYLYRGRTYRDFMRPAP